ncbi:hypothetical protein GOP47_0000263 [Adiantum capillus-veneris]|uniref:BTB domain-containing protein n=1 Tax=Adiantum capillus-veneris TaxID=13818 RepID=A0A9D4VDL0_ADICA|nr:hypothetical protein GOP47_0000263 [Adiantum capillus-veneris]
MVETTNVATPTTYSTNEGAFMREVEVTQLQRVSHRKSASSSSSVDWAEWVPECLQPAIAIASKLPYHHDHEDDEDEDDEDDGHSVDNEQDPHQNSYEEEEDEDGYHRLQEHTQFHRVHHHLHRQGAGAALRSRGRQQHQHHHQNHGGDGKLCVSCKELYCPLRGGDTCHECYEEASEAEAALKKEIEELNARIAFLRTWAPEAMSEQFSDLVLESSDGSKIRAHRAILKVYER